MPSVFLHPLWGLAFTLLALLLGIYHWRLTKKAPHNGPMVPLYQAVYQLCYFFVIVRGGSTAFFPINRYHQVVASNGDPMHASGVMLMALWTVFDIMGNLLSMGAYTTFANTALKCMELVCESKGPRVIFIDEEITITSPSSQLEDGFSAVQLVSSFFAVLAGFVAFLPDSLRYTFPYTIIKFSVLEVGSDHVLFAVVAFTLILAGARLNRTCPIAFPKAVFVASQFTLLYGALMVACSLLFWAMANDVMLVYVVKANIMVDRAAGRAVDVKLGVANYWTECFANYLVDSTFASMVPGSLPDKQAFIFSQAKEYGSLFQDSMRILCYSYFVFVPVLVARLIRMGEQLAKRSNHIQV